jgi:hypothetical protein
MQEIDILRLAPNEGNFLDNRTGSRGEILLDKDDFSVRLFDGQTKGGIALLRADLENLEAPLGAVSSSTAPQNAISGTLWFNTVNGRLYIYYTDGTSNQWTQFLPFLFGSGTTTQTVLNFPSNPTENQVFSDGNAQWIWNGFAWDIKNITDISLSTVTASGNISTNADFVGNLTGNVTGNVTGQVSDISNHGIDGLSDVVIGENPLNAQVIGYNAAQNRWENLTLSSFTGGTVPNPVNLTATTISTSSTSGALRIAGGVGIADDLYIGGHLAVEDEYIELKSRSEIRFFETDNSNYIGFRAPATVNNNVMWTLPSIDGDPGQFLRTNGSGVLSWASAAGEGGATPPGGTNTNVQFNDAGTFSGDSTFTFNSGTSTLNVPALIAAGVVTFSDSTASSTTTSGSVVITGGVGIQGQVNIGGATNKFTASTASSSTTTGTVVVTGGVGVGGSVNVGGTVSQNTEPTVAAHLTTKSYVDSNILAFSMAFGV